MSGSEILFAGLLEDAIEIVTLPEQGCTSQVRKVVTPDGMYIMKSASKVKYREWLKSEAEVLQTLSHQNSIPVPKYYGFVEEEDASHLLMSFEDGITLTAALKKAGTMKEKQRLVRSFGDFIKQLHEQEAGLKSETDWLETQLMRARLYAESGQADGNLTLLKQLERDKPQKVKQTTIHGDCTSDNVLVVDGEVRLFIDVAGMTLGDPRYDESLAIRKFRDKPEMLTSFYEGYTRYRVSDEEYLYFKEGLYEFF
ncbi:MULTISPECIES: aminoglycoside phosphotransferase family protein [unclassified Mesobacillus]|uniref:aminoglycoside phosphotransferase family protein n=1 Tax=unclassified Mesobacillus TaxID=2675270 RepID=UPI0020402A3F|nr:MULTISPECIES: aminoglycoside phosphotransferase family protein [unclassified Mesobacillus]MCM3123090.1 aminoglycoside phosphotransferase family protein [Mesobacillus sp. MER 33]MCM3233427.1 aminoglycoside phosphotransferase family protein [Mesobacillus sp. MER 48]